MDLPRRSSYIVRMRSERDWVNSELVDALKEMASRQVPRLAKDAENLRDAATALADWEESFDLYCSAIRRGTKLWHERGGEENVFPDTGALVAFLLELVEKAEKASGSETSEAS